jgi:hypothetical protein
MSLGTTVSKNIWPFSPQCVPNLLLWLDAADTSSYTPSAAITSCRNKGYSSGNTSVTGTVNATSTTINSLPAFAFAINTVMLCPSMTFTQTTRTVFVVVNIGASGSTRTFMTGGSNTTDVQLSSVTTNLQMAQNGTVVYAVTSPSPFFSTTSIVCATTLSGSSGIFINGTSQTLATNNTLAYGATTTTTQQIGISTTATFVLGEAMIFDGAVTDIDRRNIEGYLAKKWGLQSLLPATHPYYNNGTWGVSQPFNRAFSPVDIPNCSVWYDGADTASMTFTGSFVSTWADKSGNGTDATGPTGPTLAASGAGLSFNGSNQYLTAATVLPSAQTHSLFFVHTPGTTNYGNTNVFRYQSAGGAYIIIPYYDIGLGATARGYISSFDSTTTSNAAGLLRDNSPLSTTSLVTANVVSGSPNPTISVYLNGALQNSATVSLGSAATTGMTLTIGSNLPHNAQWYFGTICEMIAYTTGLTQAQRQQVETYLAWKWGLVSILQPSSHPGKSLKAFQTMFSPKSITGLQLWLDGADTGSMTFSSGLNISSWRDKSGNSFNATGVNSPQKVSTGGVSFTAASSQYFTMSVTYSKTNTMFMVATPVASTTSNVYYTNTNLTNTGSNIIGGYNSAYLVYYIGTNSVQFSNFSATLPTTPFLTSSVKTSGVTSVGYYNGTQVFSTADNTSDTASTWAFLGGASSTAGLFTGTIYEFIIYSAALSTSQRQQVEGYLAQKWLLQSSLPSTHAYKESMP